MNQPTERDGAETKERAAGERPVIVRRDQMTQGTEVENLPHEEEDLVGEAAEESFPASDPPAYTGRRADRVDPTTGHRG